MEEVNLEGEPEMALFTKRQKITWIIAITFVIVVKVIATNFMDFTWYPGDSPFQVKFINPFK